jgi:GGDEF domain-containing protein
VAKKAGDSTPEPSALSMSVGVAFYPEDGKDAEGLLAEADRRMYKSKRLRKKSVPVISIESPPVTAAAS